MADNVTLPGSGSLISSDEVTRGGTPQHMQIVKIGFGAENNYDGLLTIGQQTMAASMPVVIASDQSVIPVSQSGTWNITNISGTIALPTGAATAARQDTGNTSLATIADGFYTINQVFNKNSCLIAGVFDDTSTTACTEDRVCPTRITSYRALHINLRNNSGTEIGNSSNPIEVTLANTGSNGTAINIALASAPFPTLTNHSSPAQGKISGTSLTGSYADLLSSSNASNARIIQVFNSCNQTILISLDGGTTLHYELEPQDGQITVDLASLGLKQGNTAIQAKHAGAAPTSGTIRCTVLK